MVTILDFSQEPETIYWLIASLGIYWTLGSVCMCMCVCVCVSLLKAVVKIWIYLALCALCMLINFLVSTQDEVNIIVPILQMRDLPKDRHLACVRVKIQSRLRGASLCSWHCTSKNGSTCSVSPSSSCYVTGRGCCRNSSPRKEKSWYDRYEVQRVLAFLSGYL